MNVNDFIYDQILKGALRAGAGQAEAKNAASWGLECYKKGRYGKAKDLVSDKIKYAVKETKCK